jgi:hypothetical protein
MPGQRPAQWRGNALIEQDAHLCVDDRAASGVLENRAYLVDADTREQRDELVDRHAVLEIFE